MRIVIMGTGPFAVPTCRQLLADGHDLPLVVTRPLVDRHTKKPPPRPVYQWANEAGIEIYQPADINASPAVGRLTQCAADLFFVCDYGQILSNECLQAAKLGGINLHGSLLPRHRGAAPVQWTLLRGDREAGVTVIHMTGRLDAGPALAIARTPIGNDETAEELEPRLADIGVAATAQAIAMLAQWDGKSSIGELQEPGLVTKAPRLSKADGRLDFRLPAIELERRVRGCQPWPGTYGELQWPDGKQLRLLVRAARAVEVLPNQLANTSPGTTLPLSATDLAGALDPQRGWSSPWNRCLAVSTGTGALLIGRVQPAGKREMTSEEFLRGHPIAITAQFELPSLPPGKAN